MKDEISTQVRVKEEKMSAFKDSRTDIACSVVACIAEWGSGSFALREWHFGLQSWTSLSFIFFSVAPAGKQRMNFVSCAD